MIPTDKQIYELWEIHHFPPEKRIHVAFVDKVALFFAKKMKKIQHVQINEELLHASALTHDIDKNAKKLPGEHHPDAGVRILKEAGMNEIAQVVVTHPLHAILDPTISPKTWEQKFLFLADKMVKYEIITVDKRFDLWRAEDMSEEAKQILEECYPKVKKLERKILTSLHVLAEDIAFLA